MQEIGHGLGWLVNHAAYPFSLHLGALLFWGPLVLAWWGIERYLFNHYLNRLSRTGKGSWYTRMMGYEVKREDRFKTFWANHPMPPAAEERQAALDAASRSAADLSKLSPKLREYYRKQDWSGLSPEMQAHYRSMLYPENEEAGTPEEVYPDLYAEQRRLDEELRLASADPGVEEAPETGPTMTG